MAKHVIPSTKLVSFNCPHCGALSHQTWHQVLAKSSKKDELPSLINAADAESRIADLKKNREIEPDMFRTLKEYLEKRATGFPFMEWDKEGVYGHWDVSNAFISRCYSCEKVTFWIYDKIMWPMELDGPAPNADLPDDIKIDYEEASRILKVSPRGAAALLRLCIQKLCIFLGEPGENLNTDIGELVKKKGLHTHIQQALDVVRVVGNNAVHPGQIDLNDNREVALDLFKLVNLLAETLITAPKHIGEMFVKLVPDGAKAAIEKRDSAKSAV